MTQPALQISSLSVGYDGPVCGPITATLAPGEVLGVVGPNGSGKSTFVRTVLGLLEPLAGSVDVFGSPVDERSIDFRANVASVLDDDAYFPALRVGEHLTLVARGHGVTNADEVVDRELTNFGLVDQARMDPLSLSSGQRRRFLLASAFVRPRALLVLDEPEQRLDAAMRVRLGERLRAEADSGTAILLVTHDPALLRDCSERALLIGDHPARELDAAAAAAQMVRQ